MMINVAVMYGLRKEPSVDHNDADDCRLDLCLLTSVQ